MNRLVRFGRKIPLPSTIEIKHEMRLMAAVNDLMNASSADDEARIVTDLASRQGFSTEKAQKLVDRLTAKRRELDGGAVLH